MDTSHGTVYDQSPPESRLRHYRSWECLCYSRSVNWSTGRRENHDTIRKNRTAYKRKKLRSEAAENS